MKRYKSIPTSKSNSGKTVYTTSRYPNIPKLVSDIYVYTNIKDRYDILAQQYYGDSSLWWIISIANKDIQQDSLTPPIGTQIRIPQNVSQIISNFEELNKGNTLQLNNNTSSKIY
tara:strand:- start:821 stop:1165 length:345 start_codon:yes stop_codon:yes gene_type:complete